MSVVVWKNGKCENAWSLPSFVDGANVSIAKKSHASADGLVTAQQEVLQLTWVAFAISSVNLCVLVEAIFISAVLCKSAKCTRGSCKIRRRSSLLRSSWAAGACVAKKSPALLHWKDEMKGTTLKKSGSSTLKTLFPSIYQSFSSVYLLFQQSLLGLFFLQRTPSVY